MCTLASNLNTAHLSPSTHTHTYKYTSTSSFPLSCILLLPERLTATRREEEDLCFLGALSVVKVSG